MSHWRIWVVAGLLALPVVAWAGIGSWYLWTQGLGFIAWWPMFLCISLGYFLAWYWQRKKQLLQPPDFEVKPHWTDRDRAAWQLVAARAKKAETVPMEKFSEWMFYSETALEMSKELAAHYHPGADDPVGYLTVPEILAVIELAAHDLNDMVVKHLPGGHLLTINDLKRTQQLTKLYQIGTNVWWAVSAVLNPLETGMRYAASQAGMGQPMRMLQQNLFVWFYTAFLQKLGTYLIDLNSGRLRVGAARYRELLELYGREPRKEDAPMEHQAAGPFAPHVGEPAEEQVDQVTVTLIGQVKAGKSSLVNAILGEERAKTGSIPTTDGVSRYEVRTPHLPTKLVLHDTVGYGHSGPKDDQVEATAKIACDSDLLFLVLHARTPGRQADVEMLKKLHAWFAARPELRKPPIIGVLTHIDLLGPALEWAPPYDYLRGKRPKEINTREALSVARSQLGETFVGMAPVCVQAGKVYGVEEWLLPAVALQLDEGRGVALLRVLKDEADKDKIGRVFQQIAATGKATWDILRQEVFGKA